MRKLNSIVPIQTRSIHFKNHSLQGLRDFTKNITIFCTEGSALLATQNQLSVGLNIRSAHSGTLTQYARFGFQSAHFEKPSVLSLMPIGIVYFYNTIRTAQLKKITCIQNMIEYLYIFVQVVEQGSFTRAADILQIIVPP